MENSDFVFARFIRTSQKQSRQCDSAESVIERFGLESRADSELNLSAAFGRAFPTVSEMEESGASSRIFERIDRNRALSRAPSADGAALGEELLAVAVAGLETRNALLRRFAEAAKGKLRLAAEIEKAVLDARAFLFEVRGEGERFLLQSSVVRGNALNSEIKALKTEIRKLETKNSVRLFVSPNAEN